MSKRFWLQATTLPLLLLAIGIVGCGGGGSSSGSTGNTGSTGSTTPIPGTGVTGQTTTQSVTTTSTSSASPPAGQTTSTTTSVGGSTVTVAIPGGETITTGSQVLLVPSTLPISLTGTTGAPAEIFFRHSDGSLVDSGLQAVNGQVQASGTSYDYFELAYPATGQVRGVDMVVKGPLHVGSGSTALSVSGEVDFDFDISNGGALGSGNQSSYPTSAIYALPGNGQTTFESFVNMDLGNLKSTTPVPATLSIAWPGQTKSQTRYTNGGSTTLWASGTTDVDQIPSTGITSATLSVQTGQGAVTGVSRVAEGRAPARTSGGPTDVGEK